MTSRGSGQYDIPSERYSSYYRISTWSLYISTLQLPDCLSKVRWSAKSKIENLEVRPSGVESGVPYSSSNLTNLNRIPSSNTRNILEPGPVRQGMDQAGNTFTVRGGVATGGQL